MKETFCFTKQLKQEKFKEVYKLFINFPHNISQSLTF